MWKYFDKTPEQRKYFDDYMTARRAGIATWYKTFPFADALLQGAKTDKDAVLLVDVGGNQGHDLVSFHQAYPDAPGRLILQDLPSMIAEVLKESPPWGVECVAYDFHNGPQPIHGARAYYMRNVCHDWSDDQCETILQHTAQAMEKGYSRLLIDDFVLPDTEAPLRGCSIDFLMMMYASGIERTMSQWTKLLEKCGLEAVKIWSYRADYEQILEVRIKE